MFNNGVSLADIAAVSGRNNDGFGGDGIWALIILFALFGGFGNGNWGNNGNGANSVDAAIQRGFDNQGVMNSLRGLEQGLCSLGYDQLAQMNGINTNIMQTGFGLQGAINALSTQVGNCCCENREAIAQVRYDMATDTCSIINTMNQGFNQLDRTINDKFCQLEMRQMQEKIDEQQSIITALNLAQSQSSQNQYIDSRLNNLLVQLGNLVNGNGCCTNNC